jgi:mRNA-degrading endonuclease RelE of RelBE toxin-antitoxin system
MIEDYKVYRTWYDFTNWSVKKIQTFPKSIRNTISDRILNMTTEILEDIIWCIYKKEREEKLDGIKLKVDVLRTYWRLCVDNRWISIRNYEYICSNLDTFGKMMGGWLKSEKSKQSL